MNVNFILSTAGDGLWSGVSKKVRCVRIDADSTLIRW